VNARRRLSSSGVKTPPRLFSDCVTPIVLPSLLKIGTQRRQRVK
jgi:hypothetical protein